MPVIRACKVCARKNRISAEHLADSGKCGACKAPLAPLAEPIEVDSTLFDEIVQMARVPILVDFWAPWCGPCKAAAPEVAKTAAEMAGQAIVLKVNTDQNPEPAARFHVRGIPNFAVFSAGRLTHQQAGLTGHQQMISWLTAAAKK